MIAATLEGEISVSDSGALIAETWTLSTSFTISDPMTGADELALTISVDVSDSGVRTETVILGISFMISV